MTATFSTQQATPPIYGQRPVLILFVVGLLCVALLNLAEYAFMHRVELSFDPWGFAALPLAQFLLVPDRRPAWIACAAGLLLTFVLIHWLPALRTFAEPIGLGVASVTVLSATILVSPQRRGSALLALAAGSLVLIGQQISQIGQYFTTTDALTYDHRAYLVDLSLGFDPTAVVLSALNALHGTLHSLVVLLVGLSYAAIMLMMAWVVLIHLRHRSPRWVLALTALLLAGAVGGVLYHLFPAAGPAFAFRAFPALPPASAVSPAAAALDPRYARNCMPSLHATWALLIAINTAGLSRMLRGFAVAFAMLVIVATLYLGQHYLIDLIVAAPFTVAIQALAEAAVNRQRPGPAFWIGSGCVAAWLFVLVGNVEWLLAIPGLTLMASVLTLAVSTAAYLAGLRVTGTLTDVTAGDRHPARTVAASARV
ncbi:MAG TPA: phosphatase PAP2 family protein [Acetobacteraceae bacterium]|jgi:membrane-associated phospholipid phosphatase